MSKKKEHRLDARLTTGGNHLLNELADLLGIDKTGVVEIAIRHYARAWDLSLKEHICDGDPLNDYDESMLNTQSEEDYHTTSYPTLPGRAPITSKRLPGT